jgi:hypothetical protein
MSDRESRDASRAGKALSNLGAAKGGDARAERLSPERRREIAQLGAISRWSQEGKPVPILAKYGAPDRPLRIGGIEIPCYVLSDGRRVLAQRGLQAGVGLSRSAGKGGARRMVALMRSLSRKGIDTKDLTARADKPIRFIPTHGGNPADGYDATILPDICAVVIEAARRGKLEERQAHLAERCGILQHGFATVGIIALVDEATGYEKVRPRDALARIIEKFVAKQLRPWVRTFPTEFYREIYRLNQWEYSENCGTPQVVGHWTNNIVYKRLAPGVLDELRRLTPRDEKGRLKHRLFQRLTDDIGHPKLREHLAAVVMLMKYSPDWEVFIDRLDREFPQWGDTKLLPFPDDYDAPMPTPAE